MKPTIFVTETPRAPEPTRDTDQHYDGDQTDRSLATLTCVGDRLLRTYVNERGALVQEEVRKKIRRA